MNIFPLIDPNAVRQDGTTPLTGNWAVGGFDITGVGTLGANYLGCDDAPELLFLSELYAQLNGYLVVRGDAATPLIFGSGSSTNIGISGDTDLLQLTANNLAVNGAVAATGTIAGTNLSAANALGADLDGQSTYDLNNMVDGTFSGTVQSSALNIVAPAITGREQLIKGTVSDGGNDAFYVANATANSSMMSPVLFGYHDSSNASASLNFIGMVSAANDASDSSGYGIVHFAAERTDSTSDPLNGTLTSIANRKLFTFGGGINTTTDIKMQIHADGTVRIRNGNADLGNKGSSTAFNNAYLVYGGVATNSYGFDLGRNNSRYNSRLFCPTSGDITFASIPVSTLPTSQSDFTTMVTIRGDTGRVGIGTAAPDAALHVVGSAIVTGNTTLGDAATDTITCTGQFLPRRLNQSAEPTPGTGEMMIWRDTDDGKVYLLYNDADSGAKKIELT